MTESPFELSHVREVYASSQLQTYLQGNSVFLAVDRVSATSHGPTTRFLAVVIVLVMVPPLPVFVLFLAAAPVKILVMPMRFAFPPRIKGNFGVIPAMIIVIGGIINADLARTPNRHREAKKSCG